MKCYNCGAELSEKNFCTACGEDVSNYKKVIYMSHRLYNDGLEKANVRDLSGAIASLRESLKFDKTNVEARNLLGLVYFEMGDVVGALMEWVISKNFRSKKNLADDYIEAVQSNPARLDAINQSIKKYNLALKYCHQDSKDLAVIQLKKVLSQNPRLIQGHLLLALLYLDSEQWNKARREVDKVLVIDVGNTMALTYRKYIEDMTNTEDEEGSSGKRRKNDQKVRAADSAVTYTSGNEVIIQPADMREPRGASSILNILIGLIIGVAVSYFLILPARVQMARNGMNEELKTIGDNSDAKSARITELEQNVEALEQEKTRLQTAIDDYTGENGESLKVDSLLQASKNYLDNPDDAGALADALYNIDKDYVDSLASDAYRQLYYKLMKLAGEKVASSLYESGSTSINQSDYTTAITTLEKAWYFSSALEEPDPEILYLLANAYKQAGETDRAKQTYQNVISTFPQSEAAKKATERLAENGDSADEGADTSSERQSAPAQQQTQEQPADDNVREGNDTDSAETTDVMPAAE
ncbi:MAG: tetratricopeptide repeat protein [Lachnospiraceae bacterium]|nr:tetratricopeptide repeat protein [Lachnospiraceae bacterium]